MKKLMLFILFAVIVELISGCKKEETTEVLNPVVSKGDILYANGKIMAPSGTILSRGKTYTDEFQTGEDKLIAVKYDKKWYFFYTGLKDSTCHLSDSLSKVSMATFIARKLQSKQKSGQQACFDWELPTGLGVDEVALNSKYKFTNFKIRWAAIDNGENKYYLAPKELVSISFMEWIETGKIMGFDVQSSKEIPFAGHEYKTYGSVVRAWAYPLFPLLVDYNNLLEACNNDLDLIARINTVEIIEVMFEGITEIIGDVPVVGDCINACVEPILMLVKGLGFDLLIGKEAAMEAFKSSVDSYMVNLVSCLGSVCSGESLEAVREALDLISTLSWVGLGVVGGWDAATSKYYTSFAPPGVNILVPGPCADVWDLYPLGTTLIGHQARGYTGDFSCWSDVYTQDGVRISPGGGDGRAYFDYGPVSGGSVSVTFQWVDNAWWSDIKAIEVYNWKTKVWERIATWDGNDGIEHFSTYGIPVNSDRTGPRGQVRVAIFAGSGSVIHLNSITVN